MHFVLLAEHSAEVCPLSNANTKALILESASEMPGVADKNGVTIAAGPFVNREHLIVAIVEADKAEQVDGFIHESRLEQWNQVRVIPSMPMPDVIPEIAASDSLF